MSQYFAFGETFVEERSNPNEIIYKFNAKELDDETGLYYYGARYYDPRISIWYGVDPLAEKMPNWSPFVYTFNSPIVFSDPTGEFPWPGVTFVFLEFDFGVGMSGGVNYIRQSGVARDRVGKTHFIMNSRFDGTVNPYKGKENEMVAGISASSTVNIRQSWKRKTFLGLLHEEGWSATGDIGVGVGINFGFGESEFTIGAGLGAGVRISVNSTEVLESISLTWDEAEKVNSKGTKSNSWGVKNIKQVEGGFQANVTVGTGADAIVTDQIVFSDDMQKIWMSKEYQKMSNIADEL